MLELPWALRVFHWAHLCLPALSHINIGPGSEKTVFGSPPLCSVGHNRCLLLSVPNKGAFINGWWPTWCLVMMASPFHCPQNGDPSNMLPIPVLHLTVRINLSIHPADLTVPTAGLFLKSHFNEKANEASFWGSVPLICVIAVSCIGHFARTPMTQTLSEKNTRATIVVLLLWLKKNNNKKTMSTLPFSVPFLIWNPFLFFWGHSNNLNGRILAFYRH